MSSRKAALFGWLVFAALPLGCDTGPSEEDLTVYTRLKSVAMLYGRYQGHHRGQPPKNEEEFRKFVESIDPAEYPSLAISTPSDLFVSPRDGKPFIINYGVDAGPPSSDGSGPIIAHESPSKGALGVNSVGKVEAIDATSSP